MASQIKQKQKYCRGCRAYTLHVATVNTQDLGCGFLFANLILTICTAGLWLPIGLLVFGLGLFGNSVAPFGAKYRCQRCGRKN